MHVCWLVSDIAFKNGKVGDYLFLGNMVYTVSGFCSGCFLYSGPSPVTHYWIKLYLM